MFLGYFGNNANLFEPVEVAAVHGQGDRLNELRRDENPPLRTVQMGHADRLKRKHPAGVTYSAGSKRIRQGYLEGRVGPVEQLLVAVDRQRRRLLDVGVDDAHAAAAVQAAALDARHLLHFFSTKSFNKTLFFGRFILLVCSKFIEKYDTTDQVTAVAGRVLESASIFSIFGNFLKIIRSGYYKSFE